MKLTDQVFAQALLLAGDLDEKQEAMLGVLCRAAASSLGNRLREGLTADDCKADFIAAASLYALAALSDVDEKGQLETVTAGDVTIRHRSRDAAANCLRNQAELMISPYLQDRFSFMGV